VLVEGMAELLGVGEGVVVGEFAPAAEVLVGAVRARGDQPGSVGEQPYGQVLPAAGRARGDGEVQACAGAVVEHRTDGLAGRSQYGQGQESGLCRYAEEVPAAAGRQHVQAG
jgi:hypothetical protein